MTTQLATEEISTLRSSSGEPGARTLFITLADVDVATFDGVSPSRSSHDPSVPSGRLTLAFDLVPGRTVEMMVGPGIRWGRVDPLAAVSERTLEFFKRP